MTNLNKDNTSSRRMAFVNGKLIDCRRMTADMTNVIIAGGKVMGLGYLPDDDEGTDFFDIGNCLIVPHVCDAYVSSLAAVDDAQLVASGITAVGCEGAGQSDLIRCLPLKQAVCDLGSDVFSDKDIVFPLTNDFLSTSGESKRWHIGLSPLSSLLLSDEHERGVLKHAIESELIDVLVSGKESFLLSSGESMFVPILMSVLYRDCQLAWPSVFKLISLGAAPLFDAKLDAKMGALSLFSTPSFSVFDPTYERQITAEDVEGLDSSIGRALVGKRWIGRCLATVVEGQLVYNRVQPQDPSSVSKSSKV